MRIDELINKYFEGETSAAEEQEIRMFFAKENVPQHLLLYKPMFAYFEEEIARKEVKVVTTNRFKRRKIFYMVSGIAAAMLLLLGIGQLLFFPGNTFCSGNYVVINGRCYTDIHTVREYALNALQEVSSSPEEFIYQDYDEDELEHKIIEEQFKQLGNFFLDDED